MSEVFTITSPEKTDYVNGTAMLTSQSGMNWLGSLQTSSSKITHPQKMKQFKAKKER